MAYEAARGEAIWRGRSREAIERDGEYLAALKRLLPEVRPLVESYLRNQSRKDLQRALGGDPRESEKHWREVLGVAGATAFFERVRRLVSGDADALLDEEVGETLVDTEAEFARVELIRTWMNCVDGALKDARAPLELGSDAMPVGGSNEELLADLTASVALGRAEIDQVYREYRHNLDTASAERGSIPLPLELELARDGSRLVVRPLDGARVVA